MKNRIEEIRKEKGLTQNELAKKANVARTVVNQLETGKRNVITTNTMLKLSKALDEPIESIFLM